MDGMGDWRLVSRDILAYLNYVMVFMGLYTNIVDNDLSTICTQPREKFNETFDSFTPKFGQRGE
jgi:hypothetical protein